MKTELVEIIRALKVDEKTPVVEMSELRDHVLNAFGNPQKAEQIIDELKKRETAFEDRPFCDLFRAFAHYESTKDANNKNAIKYATKAAEEFKLLGHRFNTALAYWTLGVLYYNTEEEQKGPAELHAAVEIFTDIINGLRIQGKYGECQQIYEFLLKRLGWTISLPYGQPYDRTNVDIIETKFKKEHAEELADKGGHLSLFWLPVSSSVKAGKDGPIWADPPKSASHTEVDEIELVDKRYYIFSLKKEDKRVVLQADKKYGWAEVQGHSMNAYENIPLEEKDMVLYLQADDAPDNSLVIISGEDDTGAGYKAMVKRWNAGNSQFVSDSKEQGHTPIPRDSNHKILGIVIAVAKPLSKASSPGN